MEREASILHADVDSFYASVEQRDDPSLLGRPVIVGAGVVLAASYEAKACGVYTPMSGGRARRLCPDAVVVPPRMAVYSEASKALFEVFDRTSALVEALSIDEAFLDVGGLWRLSGSPADIAMRLRAADQFILDVPLSVGVARTKFLAKVANGVAKPAGVLLVPPGHELAFLHRLPIEQLWGVGAVTSKKLRSEGIETVAQVAHLGEATLIRMVGRGVGRQLHALSHNRDPRRVQLGRRRRSMGAQRAIGRGPKSAATVDRTLVGLVDRLSGRLRAAHRVCRTVVLRLRFDDLSRATRSHTLPESTARTATILTAARELLLAATPMIESQGITLVGVTLTNLYDDRAIQMALPFERDRSGALDRALDELRDRFGTDAINRAVLLGHNRGLEVPLLPD